MPLIRFFISPHVLSASEKKELAQSLTGIYINSKLPAFYINVIFVEVEENSFYIGGEARTNFVHITIEHIALHFPDSGRELAYMKALDDIIVPLFTAKGLNWEYHMSQTRPAHKQLLDLVVLTLTLEQVSEVVHVYPDDLRRIRIAKLWQKGNLRYHWPL